MKQFLHLSIIGLVLLMGCGTLRTVTAPTQPPTATTAATSIPTATPEPIAVPATNTIEPTIAVPTNTPAPIFTPVPRGYVSKALMGEKWPLSIDEGTIVCDRTAILLRAPDGHLYAVNGIARAQVGHFGWLDIRDITLPDPNIAGLIMNVQPLVDVGLTLCR